MTGLVHGTVNSYNYYGCRCDDCRAAGTAVRRAYRERWRGQPLPAWASHGTVGAYDNYCCRCEECRSAKSAEWHVRHPRRVQVTS